MKRALVVAAAIATTAAQAANYDQITKADVVGFYKTAWRDKELYNIWKQDPKAAFLKYGTSIGKNFDPESKMDRSIAAELMGMPELKNQTNMWPPSCC
jgi:hypothetical protein